MQRVNGNDNMIQNRELAKLVDLNLERLGTSQRTNKEQQFERDIEGGEWVPQLPPGPLPVPE